MIWLTESLPLHSFSAPSFLSSTETVLYTPSSQIWNSVFFHFSYQKSPPSLSCHSSNTRLFQSHRYSPLLQCWSARQRPLMAWDREQLPCSLVSFSLPLALIWTSGGRKCRRSSLVLQVRDAANHLWITLHGCTLLHRGQHWICEGMAYTSHCG